MSFRLALSAMIVVIGTGLAGCSQPETQETSVAPMGIAVNSVGAAQVTNEAGQITVNRAGEGAQGVTITQAPILLTFTVEGEDARVRVRQDGEWIRLRPSGEVAVMVGRGGASAVRVDSTNAATLNVRVLSAVFCDTLPPDRCRPSPQTRAEEADQAAAE